MKSGGSSHGTINKERFITLNKMAEDINSLIEKIKGSGKTYNKIIAVARGGLIPAQIISYKLGIKKINLIEPGTVANANPNKRKEFFHKSLIIDEICDSGGTLNKIYYTNHLYDDTDRGIIDSAVIYKRKSSCFIPEYYGMEVDDGILLSFLL